MIYIKNVRWRYSRQEEIGSRADRLSKNDQFVCKAQNWGLISEENENLDDIYIKVKRA